MKVMTIDPKGTHTYNPDCPMRLVPAPDMKNWMCLDCGCYILHKLVDVVPAPERHDPVRFTQEEVDEAREQMTKERDKPFVLGLGEHI